MTMARHHIASSLPGRATHLRLPDGRVACGRAGVMLASKVLLQVNCRTCRRIASKNEYPRP